MDPTQASSKPHTEINIRQNMIRLLSIWIRSEDIPFHFTINLNMQQQPPTTTSKKGILGFVLVTFVHAYLDLAFNGIILESNVVNPAKKIP